MAVTITAAQAAVAASALAEAEWYRRNGIIWCVNCAASPGFLCPNHVADLARADAYRQLRDSLGAGSPLEDQTAGHGGRTPRPALDLSRLGQERTMTHLTTMNGPPAAPSPPGVCEPADLDLVRQALADASAWRAWKAEGAGCGDCDRLDPGRCTEHAADDELAAAYDTLLCRLAVTP